LDALKSGAEPKPGGGEPSFLADAPSVPSGSPPVGALTGAPVAPDVAPDSALAAGGFADAAVAAARSAFDTTDCTRAAASCCALACAALVRACSASRRCAAAAFSGVTLEALSGESVEAASLASRAGVGVGVGAEGVDEGAGDDGDPAAPDWLVEGEGVPGVPALSELFSLMTV
jgi:hypothetical protein